MQIRSKDAKQPIEDDKKTESDELIYEKLKEAEIEMDNTKERYTKEEVLKSMNDIINRWFS